MKLNSNNLKGVYFMDNLSSNEINMILQALVDKEMRISGILQSLEENKKDIQKWHKGD